MARKFRYKRRFKIYKVFIYLILIGLIYYFYLFVSHLSIDNINNDFLKFLANYYHYYSYDECKRTTPIIDVYKRVQTTFNTPNKLLISDLVYNEKKQDNQKLIVKKSDDYQVYIYNTHQKESYSMTYVEDYNIVPDVLLMSHMIQEKLNNSGIKTLVEENDISNYLKKNDMNYGQSYQASRTFLKQVLDKNTSLKLIIDLHRDAASYDSSTTYINDLKCAKVMFVVGKEYDTYQKNLITTNKLNDKIKGKYPNLTRGVLQKSGYGVNGVYNQDLNDNIILLELGGDKNNIDELTNTINLIVPLIKEYINEKE